MKSTVKSARSAGKCITIKLSEWLRPREIRSTASNGFFDTHVDWMPIDERLKKSPG